MGSDQPPGQKPPASAGQNNPSAPPGENKSPAPAAQNKPAAPAGQAKPPQPSQSAPQNKPQQARPPGAPPRQPSAPSGAPRQSQPQGQRPPTRPKYGENKNRGSEMATMPFVFISFMFGLANMGAVPVIYVYEILKNNEKNEWPAWSGIDGLNYLFFSKNPLFVRSDMLYHRNPQGLPSLALDMHIPAVTKFVNSIAVGYLDMAVAFICFLQGVIFMWLAVRIAIRVLDKPK